MNRLACEVGVGCSDAVSMTVRPCTPPPLLLTTSFDPLSIGRRPSGKRSVLTLVPAGRTHQPLGIIATVAGSALQAGVVAAALSTLWDWPPAATEPASPDSCRNRSAPATGVAALLGWLCCHVTRTVASAELLTSVPTAETATNRRRPGRRMRRGMRRFFDAAGVKPCRDRSAAGHR